MIQRNRIDPTTIDWDACEAAMREGVQQAVWEHKMLGFPIWAMKDGKMQWIAPEDIVVEKPAFLMTDPPEA